MDVLESNSILWKKKKKSALETLIHNESRQSLWQRLADLLEQDRETD